MISSMNHLSESNPTHQASPTMTPEVAERLRTLTEDGAVNVDWTFSAADAKQGDVIYNRRRLLVSPNDEAYQRYSRIMQKAGLPYLENDLRLGDEDVVVGEISRSARNLVQIIPSVQPKDGPTTKDVFNIL